MLHFHRKLVLATVLIVTSMGATALFLRYSEPDLVDNSDLIVVGRLIGHTI
jgi:hypothetical protein